MTWTILMLVVAVLLYVFVGSLLAKSEKKPSPATRFIKKGVNLISIVLLIIGINRMGAGISFHSANKMLTTIQESQEEIQRMKQEDSARQVRRHVQENGDEMAKWAPVLGNEKGSKTIFVWTAADCPYCRRVHNELSRVIKENKDVRVVIKNFPVHGEISDIPGRWTIAAKIQSNAKAAALYEKVMANDYWGKDPRASDLSKTITANMRKYAKEVGLDVAKLEKDLNGAEVAQELSQVRELAQQFQITGTPYLIIGDQVFPGAIPYAQIVNALR